MRAFSEKADIARKAHAASYAKFGAHRRPHPACAKALYSNVDVQLLQAVESWESLNGRSRPGWSALAKIVEASDLTELIRRVDQAMFESAMSLWLAKTGRRFPAWTDVLRIVQSLQALNFNPALAASKVRQTRKPGRAVR